MRWRSSSKLGEKRETKKYLNLVKEEQRKVYTEGRSSKENTLSHD
jgi:hypothetical protein